MKKSVFLLVGVILLYLLPSLAIKAVYGPSYGFLRGEDCWVGDGQGGWVKHGSPEGPPPDVPSVEVPLAISYIPIFLPALLLILFMFTPLAKRLEPPPSESPPGEDETDEPDKEPE